jgi:hypothetical protein
MTKVEEREDDFPVEVDGIGSFRFRRRRKEDTYKIRSLYGKMTEHNYTPEGSAADSEAWIDASLQILMVSHPPNFSMESLLDSLTRPEEGDDTLVRVYTKLREKELSFRPPKKTTGAGISEEVVS